MTLTPSEAEARARGLGAVIARANAVVERGPQGMLSGQMRHLTEKRP